MRILRIGLASRARRLAAGVALVPASYVMAAFVNAAPVVQPTLPARTSGGVVILVAPPAAETTPAPAPARTPQPANRTLHKL